jgi:regulator of sigma E protease
MSVDTSVGVVTGTMAFLGRLITGQEPVDQLRGTIGIWQVTSQVAGEGGVVRLIELVGYISLSIGLINLFPIPLLDGGHLMFYAYEGLRGRPLGERAQEILFRFGLATILFLMLFAAWNDIGRIMAG